MQPPPVRSIQCFLLCLMVIAIVLSCRETTSRLNEIGAQSSLRLIRKAEVIYRSRDGLGRFGTLPELYSSGLIDEELARGIKNGYRYELEVRSGAFTAIATPIEYNVSGTWTFYLDESGVIRGHASKDKRPNVQDAPIRDQ